jgi:hypothetical protein
MDTDKIAHVFVVSVLICVHLGLISVILCGFVRWWQISSALRVSTTATCSKLPPHRSQFFGPCRNAGENNKDHFVPDSTRFGSLQATFKGIASLAGLGFFPSLPYTLRTGCTNPTYPLDDLHFSRRSAISAMG